MYIINAYEITDAGSERYILNSTIGAKISSSTLTQVLIALNTQEKREITEKKLIDIAGQYEVSLKELKHILISKLHVLSPVLHRKIPFIYLNSDDELVEKLLCDTLQPEYNVHCCQNDFLDFQTPSLLIYYRKNYSNPDFKRVHHALMDNVYLITCGVIHHQLVIDNLYFNLSGLPTHFSNLHDLMKDSDSSSLMSKNDSLAFYRNLYKNKIDAFPMLSLNPCQRGYIAYSLYQFMSRFIKFDGQPTPHDAINWRWQVDLLKFEVKKEIAILEASVNA